MDKLRLIRRGHNNHSRKIAEVSDVKASRMGCPIRANIPRAINCKTHRQSLKCNIMDDLIISTLKKRGIKRTKGFHSTSRQTGRKSHTVLFGNPHVKATRGMAFCKKVQTSAVWHCRRHSTNFFVFRGLFKQRICKDPRVGRGIRDGLFLFACQHIKARRGMAFVAGGFGGGITFAFFGQNMNQHWTGRTVFDRAQNGQQLIHIMPVNRPKIGKPQGFKKCSADSHTLQHIFCAPRAFLKRFRHKTDCPFCCCFQILKGRTGIKLREIR